jgi:hypothetical protein
MQAKWGSRYTFLENGCDIALRTRLVEYDGRPARYITRVSVAGWLEGDSQSNLSAQEAQLRAALIGADRQDFKFLTDLGGTSAASLLNSESISGVRVVDGPNFPGDTGAEYATVRRFDFEVEAEFVIHGTENRVLAWTESISIIGTGGPVRRIRVPINSPILVRQQISPRSVIRAVQRGQAVAHTRWPTAPRPNWPLYELVDQRMLDAQSPRRIGRGFVEYPLQWSYSFESDVPFVGFPNLPPLT